MVVNTAASQIGSLVTNLQVLTTAGPHGQPTPIESFLERFGITQSQIASARSQVVSQIEGLAGSVVPLLTGVFNTVLDVIIVAVISIYLLVDGEAHLTLVAYQYANTSTGASTFSAAYT